MRLSAIFILNLGCCRGACQWLCLGLRMGLGIGLSIGLFVGALSLGLAVARADGAAQFIDANSGCAAIVSYPGRWQPVSPELPDPHKIPLFAHDASREWKRLYLPDRELTGAEIASGAWRERLLSGPAPHADPLQPGLLVNSQAWIEFLQACPDRISSSRTLSPTNPDWIAPDFFELYQLPLAGQMRQVVVTRFSDRSPRFGGDYLAVYLADACPADKLFVSQGSDLKAEFLNSDGRLLLALTSPGQRLVRYLTFVPQAVDNSYFVEICRSMLRR